MSTDPRSRRIVAALAVASLALGAGGPATATDVRFFRLESRASFLPGTLDGIGIDPLGTLQLADQVERIAGVDEPFLFTAAAHPRGWVVGTGNSGRVLLVTREGAVEVLLEAAEPEVFAVLVDPDGTVYAGTSPDGKVYRLRGGKSEVVFEPGETYIWDLARAADGRLLVATGTHGRLYAVDAAGASEVFFESDDIHVRALKRLPDGDLLVGTAGEGLILRLAPDGKARTLYDAPQPEVVAFTSSPDGGCWAAVLASEASQVDLAGESGKKKGDEESAGDREDEGEVVVVEGDMADLFETSRPKGYRGARSEILRIDENGRVETAWSFEDETVYDLLWHRDRLWVATGQEGQLYSFRDGKMVLEKDVDERQIVALLPDRPGPAFVTTNAAAVFVVSDRSERRGTYTSPALDAGSIARFGTLLWRGETPGASRLSFSVRTGMSAEPDRTWSEWTPAARGAEIALGGLPLGRYAQWRAELEADDGRSPLLNEVVLSYRQENLPPKIQLASVMEPGEILVPANYNPNQQVFEPVSPDRHGIFTTLEPSSAGDLRFKPVWKTGWRTVRWDADDPNGDELTFDLAFRPERDDARWLPLVEDLDDDHYSFDATALPDGVYRFRVTASDDRSNPEGSELSVEEVTEAVVNDHGAPTLGRVTREGDRLRVEVQDASSPLRRAEVSLDAGGWQPATPIDGLLDSRAEVLSVPAPPEGGLLLLRVGDAAFNVVTFDLSGGAR